MPTLRIQPVLRVNQDDYTVTMGSKRFHCQTLRGCFKAVHGRWPEDLEEINEFIEEIVKG